VYRVYLLVAELLTGAAAPGEPITPDRDEEVLEKLPSSRSAGPAHPVQWAANSRISPRIKNKAPSVLSSVG